jgi:hypothetical protein
MEKKNPKIERMMALSGKRVYTAAATPAPNL